MSIICSALSLILFASNGEKIAPQNPREVWMGPSGLCSIDLGKREAGTQLVAWSEYQIGNWVSAWNGFALSNLGTLYSYNPEKNILIARCNVVPDDRCSTFQWTVSPDGKLLAEFDQDQLEEQTLTIRELKSGRTILNLDKTGLTRALGGKLRERSYGDGVAWSPSGTQLAFGHAYGAEIDNGGMAVSRLAVYDLTRRKFKAWGEGYAVAWISEDKILAENGNGPFVVNSDGRRKFGPTNYWGVVSGWNRHHLCLFRSHPKSEKITLEKWTPDFSKRISSRPIENASWNLLTPRVSWAPAQN